jgi:hypothetical protein
MRRIRVWKVSGSGLDSAAMPIEELSDTETERQLEDLLVSSPELLLPGLVLLARQFMTAGGPLDLIGLDAAGRAVVFELKRGTLTREAVVQALDYASDLATMDPTAFASLIDQNSGRGGVQKIEGFAEWYAREYPGSEHALASSPRMVLVGLGADERATRIVNYLAQAGIDIQLLTFHAFRADGTLLLARQVESTARSEQKNSSGTKEGNLKVLLELAAQVGVGDLLLEVGDFIQSRIPCYRWPNRTAFSFTLQERTEEGTPTARSYFSLGVQRTKRGGITLNVSPRVPEVAPEAAKTFLDSAATTRHPDSTLRTAEVWIEQSTWPKIRDSLAELLAAVAAGWSSKLQRQSADESASAGLP